MGERMVLIELRKERKLATLLFFTDTARRVKVRKRFSCWTESNALIKRRHEPGAPIAGAANHLSVVVTEHGEGRQILVLGAQPIADSVAEGWRAAENRIGVH